MPGNLERGIHGIWRKYYGKIGGKIRAVAKLARGGIDGVVDFIKR
jgi:hypothetical protein